MTHPEAEAVSPSLPPPPTIAFGRLLRRLRLAGLGPTAGRTMRRWQAAGCAGCRVEFKVGVATRRWTGALEIAPACPAHGVRGKGGRG